MPQFTPMKHARKILLLEDDLLFAQTIEDYLEDFGYDVEIAHDGEAALQSHFNAQFDLYIIDINVPKMNGIAFLKNLRDAKDTVPALFLSSFGDKETVLKSFSIGADDYLKKPCDVDELGARIKALLQRSGKIGKDFYFHKDCYYVFETKKLYVGDKDCKLYPKELQLLEMFIAQKHGILFHESIKSELWSASQTISDNSIRTYIKHLRRCIGKNKIVNHKSLGYKLIL